MSDKAEQKHTELPWKAKKRDHGYENEIFDLVSQNGTPVFMGTIYGNSKATAEFAEKACNNHYKLVEALEAISSIIDDAVNQKIINGRLPPVGKLLSEIQDTANLTIAEVKS